jgi:rod shape determining protein RodA
LSSLRIEPARSPWARTFPAPSLALDYPLLVTLLLVTGVGLVVLYSAAGGSEGAVIRQSIRFGAGLVAFFAFAQIPPRYLRLWTPWVYVAVLGLLLGVMLAGEVGGGAQRWLDLGFIRFQPSELMKLAAPMMVAWFLHERTLPPTFGNLLVALLIIAVPALLIAEQPDLGTALLIVAAGGTAILLAGMSMRLIGAAAIAAVPLAWVAWEFLLHDYQRSRVLTFIRPGDGPTDASWNIWQSQIAIGSGGTFGKGWLNGTQAHLDFLPESSTDFIFAVMGEEFGLMGLAGLLALYLVLVGRGLWIAVQAQDTYTRLVAGSLSLTFFVYVFVNAGMVSGILPVVGVPLPFVSAGGTSMVTLMAGFGMLAAISRHRKLLAP